MDEFIIDTTSKVRVEGLDFHYGPVQALYNINLHVPDKKSNGIYRAFRLR